MSATCSVYIEAPVEKVFDFCKDPRTAWEMTNAGELIDVFDTRSSFHSIAYEDEFGDYAEEDFFGYGFTYNWAVELIGGVRGLTAWRDITISGALGWQRRYHRMLITPVDDNVHLELELA